MTNEQINIAIAIAEALGWTDISKYTQAEDGWYGYEPKNGPHSKIPDYCNDLNAMNEVEKVLDPLGKDGAYEYWLRTICHIPERESPKGRYFCRANARKRAEAFLRTLGKWKE